MLTNIKRALQDRLYRKCIEEYQRELVLHTDPYLIWIRENELSDDKTVSKTSSAEAAVVFMEKCGKDFSLAGIDSEYVIFVSAEGRLDPGAKSEIVRFFLSNPDISIVYADEDVWMVDDCRADTPDSEGYSDECFHRIFPWTKPVWSPDTLFSFMYFGNIFAIRKSAFEDISWLGDGDYRRNIYDFVLKATQKSGMAGRIEDILYHKYKKGSRKEIENELMHSTDFIGAGSAYDDIRASALQRRKISASFVADVKTGITYPVYDGNENELVSIIIPSKDNVSVLKQCILSVYEHTAHKEFEIIVVDNGSSDENRLEVERLSEKYGFRYIFRPMEFNFSKMCNLGVENAKGSYILLLNDDMEAIEDMWLTRLLGQAALEHVGAVGAKLLYPGSDLIQHAGISNTISGPGHKLKQMDDAESYYYGRNRFIYDMIGVTGACLMIKKSLYISLGGLYEGLAVAYNDVDLCFRLYEAGLCNVLRNDAVLYHHESLSRGDDMKDERKLERLSKEKQLLYQRHKMLYRIDPYIGTLLNSGEPEYACRWLEPYEITNTHEYHQSLERGKKLPDEKKMNQAILVVVEDCGSEEIIKINTADKNKKEYYIIKGWAYVPGADNARYSFKILFKNSDGKIWELPVQKRYRKDVAAILPDEKNVFMTGFCSFLHDGALPRGTYELWMTARDMCSRQRLYRNMEKKIIIGS